jgi:hypothetical protein
MRELLGIFLFVIVFSSCNSRIVDQDLNVFGYKLGDSISSDFRIIESFGEYYNHYEMINESRFMASTIRNRIDGIYLSKLTYSEFQDIKNVIEEKLGFEPIHNKGETHTGLKIIGEEYYWNDSITEMEYSIGVSEKMDSNYSFSIINRLIIDSLSVSIKVMEIDGEEIEVFEIN